MSSVNKFIGIGNVTRDPEQRFTADGSAVTNLSIAINERYKDKSGETKELTEYVNIVFFGKLAEIVNQYVHKGGLIYVEGKLKTEKYKDASGIEKYSTKVVANSMQMLGGKKDGAGDAPKPKQMPKNITDIDDDVPF